jgi:hypothetical protein
MMLTGSEIRRDSKTLHVCSGDYRRSVLENLLGGLVNKAVWNLRLKYDQLNELLLIFNQPRVSKPFYQFFFQDQDPRINSSKKNKINELGIVVRKFRCFAMLCFGNFRYAYRTLAGLSDPEAFVNCLGRWVYSERQCKTEFIQRSKRNSLIRVIPKAKTWYLGYLTANDVYDDTAHLIVLLGKARGYSLADIKKVMRKGKLLPVLQRRVTDRWNAVTQKDVLVFKKKLNRLGEMLVKLRKDIDRNRNIGKLNAVRYLASEFIDVYFATSMRFRWEFEETFDVIRSIFNNRALKDLRLRWFDPTQSYDTSVIDKSLLEGLMLKRVKCTVYMAQEGETLGKDSELAATLAQGKPVIAYIPKITNSQLNRLARKLEKRPLDYFVKRLQVLRAEGFFDTISTLRGAAKLFVRSSTMSDRKRMSLFDKEEHRIESSLRNFVKNRRFRLLGDEERIFRMKNRNLIRTAARLLAICEKISWDNRAQSIRDSHPLAMQLNIFTGVDNGVLVARSIDQCSKLIRSILLNNLSFELRNYIDEKDGKNLATVLVEKNTGSRFKAITTNDTLANSFWSFYLQE